MLNFLISLYLRVFKISAELSMENVSEPRGLVLYPPFGRSVNHTIIGDESSLAELTEIKVFETSSLTVLEEMSLYPG